MPEFPKIPMMKQLWSKDIRDKKETEEKVKRNNSYENSSKNKSIDRRNVHFVLGFSKFWSTLPEPMYKTINKIIKTNNLPWLRIRMTYHRFKNLGEHLQADLSTKLLENLTSLDFMDRPCNCFSASKIDGKCAYNGKCRTSYIVYEVKCKTTGTIYIGNT